MKQQQQGKTEPKHTKKKKKVGKGLGWGGRA